MRNRKYYILLCLFFGVGGAFSQASLDSSKTDPLTKQIDSIIFNAVKQEAFPGCVVYASNRDSIIFFKQYGYHTYDSLVEVQSNSIYDLASITKGVGATLALMKLYEDSLLHLDDPIKKYINDMRGKVGRVTIREALSHQGGLHPWIPYHSRIRNKDGKFRRKHISPQPAPAYPFKLSDSLYLSDKFYKTVKRFILKSEVQKNPKYAYSGLFFYLVPELVYNLTGTTYETYLTENFYDPLQALSMGFRPLDRFAIDFIVPTEVDTFFRKKMIHGEVHDEGAIMMQGISGNAGLFSNAEDLAKVMRMLVNGGSYDTLNLLQPNTVDLFNTAQFPNLKNRRGLGWDKPLLRYDFKKSSVAKSVSRRSFGHTGYTGTLAWADPQNDLVFIFLSNRVHPSRKNSAIYRLNVRPTIHQLIYDHLRQSSARNSPTVEKGK